MGLYGTFSYWKLKLLNLYLINYLSVKRSLLFEPLLDMGAIITMMVSCNGCHTV